MSGSFSSNSDAGAPMGADNPPASQARWLSLERICQDEAWPQDVLQPSFCDRIALAIEQFLEFDDREMAVVAFASDAQVQELNSRFRGKDKPTNVLSFPAPQEVRSVNIDDDCEAAGLLGDIILARETVLCEADQQGIRFNHHVAHLIVHGILHLLGYDHETRVAAEDMEALEIEILAHLGINNPYTEELVDAG